MKLYIDDWVSEELREYLLNQEGIIDVIFNKENYLIELDIKFNENTNPNIILKHIELYQNRKYSILFEFDKGTVGNFKTLKYTIEDMCCEYCYKSLVTDLFDNEYVKSVKSNFNSKKFDFNIEFIIEYDEKYKKEDLIEYIKEKYA